MMIAAALCLVAIPLAGCMTSTDAPRSAVDRALDAYATIRARAEIALPFLPAPIARRVEAGLMLADTAAAIARSDATPAERVLALRQLTGQVAGIIALIARSPASAEP